MQLFALDQDNSFISAGFALRQKDYLCLECKRAVRLRGGAHKQLHFYHLSPSTSCRQSGKSLLHLSVQLHFEKLLSKKFCQLEQPFPKIGRIADVVWPQEKLIFEIQCSAISITEVRERNRDYGSLGYQVIWILHDKQFNRHRLSPAENFLTPHPHYYTNLDLEGMGMIYDQYAHDENFLRKQKVHPLPIDPSSPLRPLSKKQFAHHLIKRRKKEWKIAFAGDIYDKCDNSSLQQSIRNLDAHFLQNTKKPERRLWQKLFHPYRVLFQLLLEKNCD